MKCIENVKTHKIERIGDDDAHKLVTTGEWRYVAKRAWKGTVRKLVPYAGSKVGG